MKDISVNRVEHKYRITAQQAAILASRLEQCLHSDTHNRAGGYSVKSLYFDTPQNKDFFDKEDGVFFHEKVRLRIYNEDDSVIKLENKIKHGERQRKNSLLITRDEAKQLCSGDFSFLLDKSNAVSLDFYSLFIQGYRPCSIVTYRRLAFAWPENNIRVTLDIDPLCCETDLDLFRQDLPYRHIFAPGTIVLEVKYDGILPQFVKNCIGLLPFPRISVSKYAGSRKLLYYE